MALSGIQIYKLLPQTNCKDCGFPTCLAFAMKLAAKQVELDLCPHVSEEATEQLSEAAAPPVRPLSIKSNGYEVKAGNEVVLFRHEKTFYNRPGLFLRIYDSQSEEEVKKKVSEVDAYKVEYVGIDLTMGGFAVQSNGGNFAGMIKIIRENSKLPLILIGEPEEVEKGIENLSDDEKPLICFADHDNWQAMAQIAVSNGLPVAVKADTIDEMVDLSKKIQETGVKDIVLSPEQRGFYGTLHANTLIRRLALKKNFRPLGYPILSIPGDVRDPALEVSLAAQAIGKYGSFIIMDNFSPETAYPLLVLRENIFTDPQKPIQVKPGLYEINDPTPDDPVLVTTNFSITYFSVANEVESSGNPAWLLVTDSEGMSVLTAWAAGKFDAERIAKSVKEFNLTEKINNRKLVIPGHTAVLSGELEEELPDWEINVGPREAVDIPKFMKQVLV
ncbi:MAG: acetyl-CoA decarbonylase/synthase complex subunit gamma [Anaerolineales bacterium]|jgi:acetyl-CoA decarbonylase/synthase complex subunit gamma